VVVEKEELVMKVMIVVDKGVTDARSEEEVVGLRVEKESELL